jgi:hypothetical protein
LTEVDATDTINKSAIDPSDTNIEAEGSPANKSKFHFIKEATNDFWLSDSEDRFSPSHHQMTRQQEVEDARESEDHASTLNPPVPNMHGDTAASGTASKKISAIAPISPLT